MTYAEQDQASSIVFFKPGVLVASLSDLKKYSNPLENKGEAVVGLKHGFKSRWDHHTFP